MATDDDRYDNISSSPAVSDEKNILTLNGYNELFGKCEDASHVLSCKTSLYNRYDALAWMNQLESWKLLNFVGFLFDLRDLLFQNEVVMQHDDYVTLIQFFSLLEDVFRNVLLRPYVPAYRTINKDCGRYRSFIQRYEERMPFKELQFEFNGSNLLTYKATDQTKTILYALTCSILCQYFIVKLDKFDKDPKRQQRRQNGK